MYLDGTVSCSDTVTAKVVFCRVLTFNFIIRLVTGVGNFMSKSWREALKRKAVGGGPAGAGVKKPAANPFELKFNKQKFDIMNKNKPAVSVGKPGASRKKAEELRKKTLLKEYKNMGSTSRVVDRRLGKDAEDDEEAGLSRFAKARSRKESERSRFQLSDDDEDVPLTHKGQSLTTKNMNDFIDSDLDGDQPDMDNFGGFKESQEVAGKTRAEVMKELISKSKYYKLERQRIKEENETIRGDLDAQFDIVRKELLREENRRKGKEDEDAMAVSENDFDSAVRQLVFEKRLAAQNEVKKSPEELEKMLLEKEFRKQQELKKRISGEAEVEEGTEEELQLSRRMQSAEKELGLLVEKLCKCEDTTEMEVIYSQIIAGLSTSSHRQVLLAKVCRDRLAKIYKQFTARVLEGKAVVNKPGSAILLLIIGRVFSTCDFHHIVSTPAHLTGVYLLDYSRIKKVRHAVYALWICQVLLDYQVLSKRYIPEVMNTLYSLTLLSYGKTCPKDAYYLAKDLKVSFSGDAEYNVENILKSPDSISAESFKRALVDTVLNCSKLYGDLSCFSELFNPFKECGMTELDQEISDNTEVRQPMTLHDHKPIPLPQLEPFIEDDIVADRKRRVKRDENPQREIQRLKAAHKKELRGAARELRKDAAFLAREQLSEKKAKDAEYMARINRLYGSLGNEGAQK